MLSAGQVSAMRAQMARIMLPDTATIYRFTSEIVGGEQVETWSVLAEDVPCSLTPFAGEKPGEEGGRIDERSTVIIAFPAKQDVRETDRIVVDGVAYNPTHVRRYGNWEMLRRVEARESVEGIPDV